VPAWTPRARRFRGFASREPPGRRTQRLQSTGRSTRACRRFARSCEDAPMTEIAAPAAATSAANLRPNRIESLLSARLFVEPQLARGRLYFVSNLAGHLSLYSMDAAGGVPTPLLPPRIALQNPELLGGRLFHVLSELERI